jgi:hypothetical protein
MHRGIIMTQNLIKKAKKKVTHNPIGTQIALLPNMNSKITVCIAIPPLAQEPSPYLHPNQKSIW